MNDWTAWAAWFRSLDWFGWLTSLDKHSGAVTSMVTAVYAIFTILLWQATKRQAAITRRIFEASQRPYLNLLAQAPTFIEGHIHFVFHMENPGAVPAIVTSWDASVRLNERVLGVLPREHHDLSRVVFPGSPQRLGSVRVVEPNGLRLPGRPGQEMLVEASIAYRGAGDRQFSTRIVMELFATSEVTAWDYREVSLDP